MKKWIKVFLSFILALSFIVPVQAKIVEDNGQFCNDDAGILSVTTEKTINDKAKTLEDKSGAQIVVVTVDFTDGMDIEDYAYELFNTWGLGDKNKNNGVLILVVAQQNDYWVMQGSGIENIITTSFLSDVVYDNKMNDAVDNHTGYDEAILGTFNDIYTKLDQYYGSSYEGQTNSSSSGLGVIVAGMVEVVIAVVIMMLLVVCLVRPIRRRRYYTYGPRPRGFFRPRPPRPPRPYEPRPPRFGGFSSPRSSSRSSSRSSFSSSSRGSSSRGAGGGRSRGGGVGRH